MINNITNMQTIYKNESLSYIINAISYGTVGVEDINNLLIKTTLPTHKYAQIIIKPALIDISEAVVDTIGEAQIECDLFDTSMIEYLCVTKAIEEIEDELGSVEEKPIVAAQSLSEMVLLDPSFLQTTGWDLLDFTEN